VDPSAIAELAGRFRGRVVSDPEALTRYAHDASSAVGRADAAVAPADESDVEALVRWARSHRIPLVPRGGGTSLTGGSVPLEGGLVVDFGGWDRVLEVLPEERLVRVQPGVVNYQLHRTLLPHRLFLPPNPGSWQSCTIGGNVATNASGPRSFRYGSIRAWVRQLSVVLGTGERVQLGSRTRKRSLGPELLNLFVGSEGALGLITEVTLALAPAPPRRWGVVVALPASTSLGSIVVQLSERLAPTLSAVEFLDERVSDALARVPGRPLPVGSRLLLLELEDWQSDAGEVVLEQLSQALASMGLPPDPAIEPNADDLWSRRGQSGVALAAGGGPRLREDVAVPIPQLDNLLAAIVAIAQHHGVEVATFGHLGEGNLHPNFWVEPESPEGRRIQEELLETVRRMGGTVSGEHGLGAAKARFLSPEMGPTARELLETLKGRCDPDGILNPGKLFA
jgi:D-lactate dehydrogenase